MKYKVIDRVIGLAREARDGTKLIATEFEANQPAKRVTERSPGWSEAEPGATGAPKTKSAAADDGDLGLIR